MRRAPLPWHFELALPDPACGLSCIVLGVDIVEGILAKDRRPSLLDHPAVKIFAADVANRDNAAVVICVPFLAAYRSLTNSVSECQRCLLATAGQFLASLAESGTFGAIDAEQTDPLISEEAGSRDTRAGFATADVGSIDADAYLQITD